MQVDTRATDGGQRRSGLGARALEFALGVLTQRVETDPVEWIEHTISLSRDVSAAGSGTVHLDPYQLEPIRAQYDRDCREVVIMAVEQTGKSSCWRWPLIHRMLYRPGPAWVIYESDEKAEDINREQFDPVIRAVPDLAPLLDRTTAQRRRYQLANGALLDFSGAGADITSKPRRDGVADELDRWPLSRSGIDQNLRNFRKRFRTYWARGEGCLVVVSSPKGADSPVADVWDETSRGTWHLRCQKCGALSIPSHAIHHLLWELTEARTVKPETLGLECPACGHEHRESEAAACNLAGAYVHEFPEQRVRRGFQWGALACPRVLPWLAIAEAQMGAGRTADAATQEDFDNSWRGLRFRPRRNTQPKLDALRAHSAPLPDPATLANVFWAADTQDSGWYWTVRGIDQAKNTYHLGAGFAKTEPELAAAWDAEYLGIRPAMGCIDHGGHGDRPRRVAEFVRPRRGLYMYKGNSHIGTKWKLAKEDAGRMILANPYQYQSDLLYYLYSQTNREQCYWFLEPDPPAEYIEHLAALAKDDSRKHGDRYENWTPGNRADHWFDAEKMMLVLIDFALTHCRTWRRPMPGAPTVIREHRRAQVAMT